MIPESTRGPRRHIPGVGPNKFVARFEGNCDYVTNIYRVVYFTLSFPSFLHYSLSAAVSGHVYLFTTLLLLTSAATPRGHSRRT